jgi:hypothetical protein
MSKLVTWPKITVRDSAQALVQIESADGGIQKFDWNGGSESLNHLRGLNGKLAAAAVQDYITNSSTGAIVYSLSVST